MGVTTYASAAEAREGFAGRPADCGDRPTSSLESLNIGLMCKTGYMAAFLGQDMAVHLYHYQTWSTSHEHETAVSVQSCLGQHAHATGRDAAYGRTEWWWRTEESARGDLLLAAGVDMPPGMGSEGESMSIE